MAHDRIHAREPTRDRERWRVGTVTGLTERDGHCVVTVAPEAGSDGDVEPVELVVTFAIRDLFVGRLDIGADESPIGERVWFRTHGGR